MLNKNEISKTLELIADLLTLKGENQFKIKAFLGAGRKILQVENFEQLIKEKKLTSVKGIGKSIAEVIEELYYNNSSNLLEELKKEFPDSLIEMFSIKGLGAKKIKVLFEKLGIKNIGELEYACNENRLLKLKGFGEKTQKNILKSIAKFKMRKKIFHFPVAIEFAKSLIDYFYKNSYVEKIAITGDLRRKLEVIDKVEFVVLPLKNSNFMEILKKFSKIENISNNKIIAKIENFNTIFYIADIINFHKILFLTTGSTNFLKQDTFNDILNKYEISKETDIFKKLNIPFIPAECRENFQILNYRELVYFGSLNGVFHIHTEYSDGINSINEIVNYLKINGYKYAGISDHSKSAFYANGLKVDDILKQHEEIDFLNEKHYPFKIFKGIESDILKNGELDYPDNILELFDFVIASVHSSFTMDKNSMTERLIKAVENPFTTIVGHPTGRLLLYRDEYIFDLDRFLKAVAENDKFIEINTHPYRLDFSWENCIKAKEMDIKFFINPDAHNLDGFEYIKYGINVARKAFLTDKDVINCRETEEVKKFLKGVK